MRGFSALILIIFIAVLVVGATFLFRQNNVKGVRTEAEGQASPGFLVSIISKAETWDLYLYACGTESECLTSLESGKRLSKISGGATELKEVKFMYSEGWKNYNWLKVFAKPGLVKSAGVFEVLTAGDIPGSYTRKLGSTDALLVPINTVSERFYHSTTFSDH